MLDGQSPARSRLELALLETLQPDTVRVVFLCFMALLVSVPANAQTSLIRDLRGTPDDLVETYGEPDAIVDTEPYDLWRYLGSNEGIARSYGVSGMDVVLGTFMMEYYDESAAYARIFALQDGLSDLGFSMSERDGNGIYNASGLGSREGALLNVMRYPEVGGRFSYKVRLSLMDLPPSLEPTSDR